MEMTIDEEAQFITSQVLDARFRLEQHKKAMQQFRAEQARLEQELEVVEQALADYCTGNGLKAFDTPTHDVKYSESESIDVLDISAVPPEFIRTKTTQEPNKILIKELRPLGNWFTIKKSPKITITHKDA